MRHKTKRYIIEKSENNCIKNVLRNDLIRYKLNESHYLEQPFARPFATKCTKVDKCTNDGM